MLGLALLVVIGFWILYATNNPVAWPDLKAAFGAGSAANTTQGGSAPTPGNAQSANLPPGQYWFGTVPGEPAPIKPKVP